MTGLPTGAGKTTSGHCHCGAVHWVVDGEIPDATICNCTACRRYAALWAYGYDGVDMHIKAPEDGLTAYAPGKMLTFNFCKVCGNLVSWRALQPGNDGRTRIAVNLRLADPAAVTAIPLQRSDGLHSFDDLPKDGRTVGDVCF